MNFLDVVFKFFPIVISVFSVFLSVLSLKKSNAKAAYLEQDKQYAELLKFAMVNDPELRDYKAISERLQQNDKNFIAKYNIYAYMIWNCMETFFDLTKMNGRRSSRNVVDSTWLPVILEENKIHYNWFKRNQRLFKEDFRKYINSLNDVVVRQGTVNDIENIYPLMAAMFPQNELKSKESIIELMNKKRYTLHISENTLVTSKNSIIGFALIYSIPEHKSAWLDYFAVNPVYQDIGYGTLLFNNITSNLEGGNINFFLELDIPKSTSHHSAENRRIRFYERQGVKIINVKYKYPAGNGVPMHLAYRPANTNTVMSDELLKCVVEDAMNSIHADEPNMPKIRDEVLKGIKEIKF